MPITTLITYLAPFIGYRAREYGMAYMKIGIKGLILGGLDFALLLLLAILGGVIGAPYIVALYPLLLAIIVWAIKGDSKVFVPGFVAMLAILFLDAVMGGQLSTFLAGFIPEMTMDKLQEALMVIPTDFTLVLLGGFIYDVVSGASELTEEVAKRL